MSDRETREFEARQEAQAGEYVPQEHDLRDLYHSPARDGWVWRCACRSGDVEPGRSQAVEAFDRHMAEEVNRG